MTTDTVTTGTGSTDLKPGGQLRGLGSPRPRYTLRLPAVLHRHNVPLWVGLALVVIFAAALIFGPMIWTVSPLVQNLALSFAGPSAAHPLGTDQLGRDLLARLLVGGRIDVAIAVAAVIAPFVVGSLLGAIAGYFGGVPEAIIMRLGDLVSAFPFYVLVIGLVFALGNGAGSMFVAITSVSWVAYARIVRGETVVLKQKDFIAACRAGGLSTPGILARHVVPNTVTQAVVFAMSDIVLTLGVIVTLSFFGLGIVPPTPDWGQIMNDGQQYLAAGRYALTVLPGACIVALSLALALVGDGLANLLKVNK